jgi:uroporphyrin-III C-methyltransferase/precorrin-2 dehydrogenase/sirohydrochlorin ferrochelatase
MGLTMIRALASAFIAHGMAADMPVAVIDNGTRRAQRVVTGSMADIAGRVETVALAGPAIIVIGTVVSLREQLAWYGPDSGESALSEATRENDAAS